MPIEVGIWRIDGTPEKVPFSSLETEKKLEDVLQKDISVLDATLMVVGRQVRTASGKLIDLLGINAEGDLVVVESRRGRVRVRAQIGDRVRPGTAFMPFHWGSLQGAEIAANELTLDALDPISKEPELKYCAVTVERAETAPVEDTSEELAICPA
jgi:anaerobic selenocysteine-containing dehydrogenase